jgi:hypothetical protein
MDGYRSPQKCGPIGPQGYDRRITCIDGIETPILAFKLSGRIGRLRSFRTQIIYSGNIDYCSFREGTVLTGRISVLFDVGPSLATCLLWRSTRHAASGGPTKTKQAMTKKPRCARSRQIYFLTLTTQPIRTLV